MRRLVRLFGLLAIAVASLPLGVAAADPYPVTSTADSGAGSLRQSIEDANAHMGADTIPIEVIGSIGLEAVLPVIVDDVSIIGPGAEELTVERASLSTFRIFAFGFGTTSSLSGLTVTGGVAITGGGILNSGNLTVTGVSVVGNEATATGGAFAISRGGGISSSGPLTLRESTVRGNEATATGGSTITLAEGGGVIAGEELTVDRSTIAENAVNAFGDDGETTAASGGGLEVEGGGATLDRSTVSGNSVLAAEATGTNRGRGGGIDGSEVQLTGSTVTGNEISSAGVVEGANLNLATGLSLVRDTIVADALGGTSCTGPVDSGGFNLDEDGSCGFDKGSDLAGVDPGLDPVLKDNGGPTPTHALLAGSVAIDRGDAFGATTDQRGLPRPSDFPAISNLEGGDGSDVGAFELQAPAGSQPPPGVATVTLVAGDRTPPNTRILRGPSRVTFDRLAKFRFKSTEVQSSFQCKVDKRPWRGCRSPYKRRVGAGAKHLFKVRAIDRFSNVDPTPARFGWRVKALGG